MQRRGCVHHEGDSCAQTGVGWGAADGRVGRSGAVCACLYTVQPPITPSPHRPCVQCPQPLPLWLIVDGALALVTVGLSILDMARVDTLDRAERADRAARAVEAGWKGATAGDSGGYDSAAEDGSADGWEGTASDEERIWLRTTRSMHPRESEWQRREARLDRLGTYACLGATIIFVLPFLRLLWVLYGLDMVYQADPSSLGSLALTRPPELCHAVLVSTVSHSGNALTARGGGWEALAPCAMLPQSGRPPPSLPPHTLSSPSCFTTCKPSCG